MQSGAQATELDVEVRVKLRATAALMGGRLDKLGTTAVAKTVAAVPGVRALHLPHS